MVKYSRYVVKCSLDDLSENQLEDLLALARNRVLHAFASAQTFCRGRWISADCYIDNLGSRQNDLVMYVAKQCHDKRKFFVSWRLVVQLYGDHLPHKLVERIARGLEVQLLRVVVEEMCSTRPVACEVWRHDDGTWNILPSSLDAYWSVRRARKRTRHDKRNHHGRVRSQARRAGGPSSIGYQRK